LHYDALTLFVFSGLVRMRGYRVGKKLVITLDVDKGVLGKIRSTSTIVVGVNQIGLRPERSESHALQILPESKVHREGFMPSMNLQLELTKGKRHALFTVRVKECGQGVEFPALNVNFEDIDPFMTVHVHESLESVHLVLVVGTMGISSAQTVWVEMSAVSGSGRDLRTE